MATHNIAFVQSDSEEDSVELNAKADDQETVIEIEGRAHKGQAQAAQHPDQAAREEQREEGQESESHFDEELIACQNAGIDGD